MRFFQRYTSPNWALYGVARWPFFRGRLYCKYTWNNPDLGFWPFYPDGRYSGVAVKRGSPVNAIHSVVSFVPTILLHA